MVRHLNNIDSRIPLAKYNVGPLPQHPFSFGEASIYMDVNSLDLYQCAIDEKTPEAKSETWQFPMCPNRDVRMIVLEVTHMCQLACDYCYVQNCYDAPLAVMSFETAKKALDTLVKPQVVEQHGFQLGFFGGEATLAWSLIEEVVAYALEKFKDKVKFHLTTNACNITEVQARFLAKHKFTVIVSLDGPKELHDMYRKYPDGRGSFDDVIAGLHTLKACGVERVTLRSTFLPACTSLCERTEFLNSLCDKGLASGVSIEPAFLSESPCVTIPPEDKLTIDKVVALRGEYESVARLLAARMKANKSAYFHNILTFARRLFYKHPTGSECGAGVGYISVSPSGELFACHRQTDTKIGSLELGGIDERLRQRWVENRHYQSQQCCKCDFHNICGGHCRELSLRLIHKIDTPDPLSCQFRKHWIAAAVLLLSELDDITRAACILHPKSSGQRRSNVNFVREAGGFGDIISMSGAARALKKERPNIQITACVPNEFVFVATHLEGIDAACGLGPLEYLIKNRRERNGAPNKVYLHTLPPGDFVDLWCPAWKYEMGEKGQIRYSRSEIFALAAGCFEISNAVPRWKTTKEEKVRASKLLEKKFGNDDHFLIGLAPRGVHPGKNMSPKLIESLLDQLIGDDYHYNVVYLDCVMPAKTRSEHVLYLNEDFCQAAAVVEQCDALITVDTSFLHLGVALGVPTVAVFGMTDHAPYELYYTASNKAFLPVYHVGELMTFGGTSCGYQCNHNPAKGYTEECGTRCARIAHVTATDIVNTLCRVRDTCLLSPSFEKARKERMLQQ